MKKPRLLRQCTKEQQTILNALLDKDIELTKKQIEVMKRGIKKLHKRIQFFKDVKQSRQTLKNLARIVKPRASFAQKS